MTNSPVTRIKKTYFYGAIGIILGLAIGLLIGWVLWPVSWTDAGLANLRPETQQTVMSNAILSYTLTNDSAKAAQIFNDFGDKAGSVLDAVRNNPGLLNAEQIGRFATAISAPAAGAAPVSTSGEGNSAPAENPPALSKESTGTLGLILLGLLVVGAAAVYYFFFRNKEPKGNSVMTMVSKPQANSPTAVKAPVLPARPEPTVQAPAPTKRIDIPAILNKTAAQPTTQEQVLVEEVHEKPIAVPDGKPIAQFLTTYMYGDDLYDESFIFDAPNGAFLGECGVSFSDIVGSGEPKKISAFEIWLFDKNDVQTVTNVLMCQHAFEDVFMRENLEKKGDSVLAETGKRFAMETAALVLEGHVVDLTYGELLQTPQSYFQRLTLELAVYEKK